MPLNNCEIYLMSKFWGIFEVIENSALKKMQIVVLIELKDPHFKKI